MRHIWYPKLVQTCVPFLALLLQNCSELNWAQKIFKKCLGVDFEGSCYETSMGVMLAKQVHTFYDDYKWSFYFRVAFFPVPFLCGLFIFFFGWHQHGEMIVHVFDGRCHTMLPYHGFVIGSSRFRIFDRPEAYPDAKLMRWHYKQCVLKNIRGFSSGLHVGAE
jgi:hypothetical protein